jgi:hypothetical protein
MFLKVSQAGANQRASFYRFGHRAQKDKTIEVNQPKLNELNVRSEGKYIINKRTMFSIEN